MSLYVCILCYFQRSFRRHAHTHAPVGVMSGSLTVAILMTSCPPPPPRSSSLYSPVYPACPRGISSIATVCDERN